MYSHSFRYRVSTSSFTLPAMAVAALLLWVIPSPQHLELWVGVALMEGTAFLLSEWNNRFALLRVRSRMIGSTFLALMTMVPSLHAWRGEMLAVVCFILSYLSLSRSYQKPRAEGETFNAFFLLGISSLMMPFLLMCGIFYYVSMAFQLRTLTWRTFMAGLLGVLAPYWIYAAIAVWQHNFMETLQTVLADFQLTIPDYSALTFPQLVTFGLVVLLSLAGVFHFFHTAYNDKIRTRMIFYMITTQEFVLLLLLLAFPTYYSLLLRLLIFNSAPIVAHHLTLAKGRVANAWFHTTLWLVVACAVLNYLCTYGALPELATLRPLDGVTAINFLPR